MEARMVGSLLGFAAVWRHGREWPIGWLGRLFFFEKKNQKTFATAPAARRTLHHPCAAPVAKVFASFFKKKRLLGATMAEALRIEICTGAALEAALPSLARLRLTVFRDWPYLYDGTEEYESAYLRTYLNAPGAAVVIAWDGDAAVGASTCLPMPQAEPAVQAPFLAHGLDLSAFFYFGESVLLPAYRGRGAGVRFFELREAQARAHRAVGFTTFCAVERPADHPLRPPGAKGLEAFWAHRGYTKRQDLTCRFSWKDIDEADETQKTLMFWVKSLYGEALP